MSNDVMILRERPVEELRVVPGARQDQLRGEARRDRRFPRARTAPANRRRCASSRASSRPRAGTARVNGHDVFDEPLAGPREPRLPPAARAALPRDERPRVPALRGATSATSTTRRFKKRATERRRGVRPRAGARQGDPAPVARLPPARRPRPGAHPRPADPHPRRADERSSTRTRRRSFSTT